MKEPMQVMIDEQLKRRFKAACVLKNLSMSEVVEGLLTEWLARLDEPSPSAPAPKRRGRKAKSVASDSQERSL